MVVHVSGDKETAVVPRNIQEVVPFGGGSVMVWGCVSFGCKMNIITIRGNLNGPRYQQEILERTVIPYSDNHPIATRTIFMDDNARPQNVLSPSSCTRMQLRLFHGQP